MSWCAHCIQTSSLKLHWHCRGGAEMDSGEGLWTPLDKWPCGPANRYTGLFSWSNFSLKVSNCQWIKPKYSFIVHPICDKYSLKWIQTDMHYNNPKGTWWENMKYIELQKRILCEHIGKSTISHESYLVISHYRREPNARLIRCKIIALRMLRKLHNNNSYM